MQPQLFLLLGKSFGQVAAGTGGPYAVAACDLFEPGSVATELFEPGAVVDDLFEPGSEALDIEE